MQTIDRAQGLILRTRLFTETSLIVNWLTAEFGRISTVAKGARRAKSPFRGKLDLLYEAEFSFQRSQRSELHTLREVVFGEIHTSPCATISAICNRPLIVPPLIEQTTERETPLPVVFELMRRIPALTATHVPPRPQSVFAFELKLLE